VQKGQLSEAQGRGNLFAKCVAADDLGDIYEKGRVEVPELKNVEQGLFFPGSGDGIIVGDSILDDGTGTEMLAAKRAKRIVRWTVRQILNTPEGNERLAEGRLKIVGVNYEVESGRVRFLPSEGSQHCVEIRGTSKTTWWLPESTGGLL
jgi:hypothetical protein